jgi:hypothetical protein
MKLIILFISFILFLSACTIQKTNIFNQKNLIFKISVIEFQSPEASFVSYVIISPTKLDSFRIGNDSIENSTKIIYNFIKNGAFYMLSEIDNYRTFCCCEYGDVEEGIVNLMHTDTISSSKIEEYNLNQEEQKKYVSLEFFLNKSMRKFNLRTPSHYYKISIWAVNAEFCLCKPYMQAVPLPHQMELVGYTKHLKSINKPDKKTTKKIKNILKSILEL